MTYLRRWQKSPAGRRVVTPAGPSQPCRTRQTTASSPALPRYARYSCTTHQGSPAGHEMSRYARRLADRRPATRDSGHPHRIPGSLSRAGKAAPRGRWQSSMPSPPRVMRETHFDFLEASPPPQRAPAGAVPSSIGGSTQQTARSACLSDILERTRARGRRRSAVSLPVGAAHLLPCRARMSQ